MEILVVGSVALDSVETTHGDVHEAVGGAATFFSASACYFAPVKLVGVVGDDYPMDQINYLKKKGVDFSGLQVAPGKTFRWKGKYLEDMNQRETIYTHLNVFADFKPHIPDAYKTTPYVFLANIAPELQLDVLNQVKNPKFIGLDTMNFWIGGSNAALRKVLERVDVFMINDEEARQLSGKSNLLKAAQEIFKMGPKIIIIKKGEHGAVLMTKDQHFIAPAMPLEHVWDPTGAGDTFAGGFMGYVTKTQDLSFENLKRAVIYGSAMASYCVQDFSLNALKDLTQDQIFSRVMDFKRLSNFEEK